MSINGNETLKTMLSPQTGECIPIIEIPDEVFSEKILGDGVAILPTEDDVLSPVDGEIIQVAETGHAFCIRSDDGLEIMIHIGVDTVTLGGKGFKCFVKKGDKVHKGDKIALADIEFIEKSGFPLHTALLITNFGEIESMNCHYQDVKAGKNIVIEYKKKS